MTYKEHHLQETSVNRLSKKLEEKYKREGSNLGIHGWEHIVYVRRRIREFAAPYRQQLMIEQFSLEEMELLALIHDLNHFIPHSGVSAGEELRRVLLKENGYSDERIHLFERCIQTSEDERTQVPPILPVQLSRDADVAYQVDPQIKAKKAKITVDETTKRMAARIVKRMKSWAEIGQGSVFYTEVAKKEFNQHAISDLQFWEKVLEN